MNRRGFFRTLAAATAGFTILPPATTYDRVWKATYRLNPEWAKATHVMQGGVFNPVEYAGQWRIVYHDMPCIYDPRIAFDLTSAP